MHLILITHSHTQTGLVIRPRLYHFRVAEYESGIHLFLSRQDFALTKKKVNNFYLLLYLIYIYSLFIIRTSYFRGFQCSDIDTMSEPN